MPRTKAGTVPKLQHHWATGQARVTITGRDYYCGRWGSKEAIAKYHRLLGEYFNSNNAPPLAEESPPPAATPHGIEARAGAVQTVTVGPGEGQLNLGDYRSRQGFIARFGGAASFFWAWSRADLRAALDVPGLIRTVPTARAAA